MATTYFDTINGEITGEFTSGVQKDYMRDALGSVTGYVDANGSVVNRYWNKPYGAQLAKTGTGADPAFQWCGSLGYRPLGRTGATHDVRARDYDSAMGRWTTADSLFVAAPAYSYAGSSPVSRTDRSGLLTDFAVEYAVSASGAWNRDTPIIGIAAFIALPNMCVLQSYGDYLNFYMSLHDTTSATGHPKSGYEGGVSFFTPGQTQDMPQGGWHGLLTAMGQSGEKIITMHDQSAGQVLGVSLEVLQDQHGTGVFTLVGGDPPYRTWQSNPTLDQYPKLFAGYGKIHNADYYCNPHRPPSFDSALWGGGAAYGSSFEPAISGLPGAAVGWAAKGPIGAYSTTNAEARRGQPVTPDYPAVLPRYLSSPLYSKLRPDEAYLPCDNGQFLDWAFIPGCHDCPPPRT